MKVPDLSIRNLKNIFMSFLDPHAVHLTYITKQNEYLALCFKGGGIRDKKTLILYIAALIEGSDDILDTKTLNLAVQSACSTCCCE